MIGYAREKKRAHDWSIKALLIETETEKFCQLCLIRQRFLRPEHTNPCFPPMFSKNDTDSQDSPKTSKSAKICLDPPFNMLILDVEKMVYIPLKF